MRRHVQLLLIVLSWAGTALTQQEASLEGKVTDAQTLQPIVGANVTLDSTTLGTTTDLKGMYRIPHLPPGKYRLRVAYVGYTPSVVQMTIAEGEQKVLNVMLVPSIIYGQPITVTATRGKERETPAAFANLEKGAIRDRYTTQDIPVLLSELPSSTYYSESGSGIGYTYLNIRGFDSRRIAVMINGIPQNDPEDHNVYWLDFPDLAGVLEDVQVQRGAGSAFYGPPAIGGSVNLVTHQFASERSLQVSAGLGSYNTRRYAASFSSGLVDNTYAFQGQLSKIMSNGYRDRSWVDFSAYFFGAIRYDEDMTTQLNFYGGPIADHLAYYGIAKDATKDRSQRRANPIARNEEMENFSQPHYELFHEWRLTPSVTLNNTLFYVTGDGFFDYDGSWAPYSYYRITDEYGFSVTGNPDSLYLPGALIRAWVGNRQYGWLPRLTVKHVNGEFIGGAELRIHRSEHWGRLQWTQSLPPDVPYDYRYYQYNGAKDMLSLYAHEQYLLRNDLSLMLNLQYAYSRYRLYNEKFIGTDFSVPYHFLNPRVGMNYNIDQHWSSYVSVAYTSREPRLVNLYNAAEASTVPSMGIGLVTPQFALTPEGTYDFSKPLVKPESLLDLELGTQYRADAVHLGVNFYWMEFANEIVNSGQVDRFGQPVTGNAEKTRHLGVEVTATLEAARGLQISGNATVSHNRIIRSVDYSTTPPTALDGNPIAGFPEVLANLRLTYRAGPLTFAWTARYVGKEYTDNFRNEENTVDPSFVNNAGLIFTLRDVLRDVNVEAKLQVNNLFDVLYDAHGEGDQFFVGAERNVFFNLALSL